MTLAGFRELTEHLPANTKLAVKVNDESNYFVEKIVIDNHAWNDFPVVVFHITYV